MNVLAFPDRGWLACGWVGFASLGGKMRWRGRVVSLFLPGWKRVLCVSSWCASDQCTRRYYTDMDCRSRVCTFVTRIAYLRCGGRCESWIWCPVSVAERGLHAASPTCICSSSNQPAFFFFIPAQTQQMNTALEKKAGEYHPAYCILVCYTICARKTTRPVTHNLLVVPAV